MASEDPLAYFLYGPHGIPNAEMPFFFSTPKFSLLYDRYVSSQIVGERPHNIFLSHSLQLTLVNLDLMKKKNDTINFEKKTHEKKNVQRRTRVRHLFFF